ncbi:hypothetical protein ABID08_002188 [Rhizobium binae]|uniref:Uncharacterized protein n=1 Tax=Rhizobium binae TaxID=1138190 RepID=A0ABV2MED8_9HYPH|nr:hypothetical protein [Rhizobium binae]MBX4966961.1 hypothetical protein [Rhizobium binae]MBX4993012.1 hypothetical protein [Rhizobium binae]QSY84515.1 hypothetical protein J2J99_09845 [Rhizobium binae]
MNHREEAAAATSDDAADAVEARTLDAFRAMAADQRRKMIIRCVDISSGSSLLQGGLPLNVKDPPNREARRVF